MSFKKHFYEKKIKLENSNWKFGGNVPQKFESHIKKSIPFL